MKIAPGKFKGIIYSILGIEFYVKLKNRIVFCKAAKTHLSNYSQEEKNKL